MNSEHYTTDDMLSVEAAVFCLTSVVGHRSGICAVGSPWSELTTQNELRSESAPSRWKEKSLCRLGFHLPRPSLYKRCLSNKMYFRCLAESRNVAEVQLRRCDPVYLKEKKYWEIVAVSHGNTPKPK